jgi:Mg-chelatase subunit ChlD
MRKSTSYIIKFGFAFLLPCATLLVFKMPPAWTTHEPAGSFVAGTVVLTEKGAEPIESVRAGTRVWSQDPATGIWVLSRVADSLIRRSSTDLVTMQAGADRIEVTGDHAFWVVGKGDGSAGGDWIAARSLAAGFSLLTREGKSLVVAAVSTRRESVEVYDLTIEDTHAFCVGGPGILVGDSSRLQNAPAASTGAPSGSSSGGGGCFPAGTPVLTNGGTTAIDSIAPGAEVWAVDQQTGYWRLARVSGIPILDYDGDMMTIGAGGFIVTATGNHPFRVIRGEGLSERPPAADVPETERASGADGCWIEARHLRVGDLLESKERGPLRIESLQSNRLRMKVYNLQVADAHSYAVTAAGILAHNKGSAEKAAPGTAPSPQPRAAAPAPQAPAVSGLRAGYADDNEQFNYFIGFLKDYGSVPHKEMKVDERIVIGVKDRQGKSLPDCIVHVSAGGKTLCKGMTHADGTFLFFPTEYDSSIRQYSVSIQYGQQKKELALSRTGNRSVEVVFDLSRPVMQSVPLDVLFILDTTGSMGEETERLKATIEIINLNLSSLSTRPRVRFGMVLYKDRGDEYLTKTVALTEDVADFRLALGRVRAAGGGDGPEDLQSALLAAMRQIDWNPDGVRLAFVITDAAPHLDYNQDYTYALGAREAREKGIKIHTVGSGGLDTAGEYVLRQISQYTGGRYIFLTYGEQGESKGGAPGSVSHHTGANWQADKLETIIIRFAKEELQYFTDTPVEEDQGYFEARQVSEEPPEETLGKLFSAAARQLVDFSATKIVPGTPTAVLPIQPSSPQLALPGEYLTEQVLLSLGKDETLRRIFRMVERKDLQQVLKELEIQQSGLIDDAKAAKVGAFLGADLLVTGTLYEKAGTYELFLKLVRVETAEILSVTKAVVDKRLAL